MSSAARTGLTIVVLAIVVVIAAIAFGFIDINQTKKGALPEVAISGGQVPAYDVKTADVSVGTKKTSVDVPKVEVGTTSTTVEVPTVDVKKPN